jgi:hypothetical protein
MSIHDETWDKCPKCNQTIKTWHDWNDCFTPITNANLSELFVMENKKYTKEEISRELRDIADKFDTEAIKAKLDNKLEEFYNKAGLAMSLRLSANFLEGVESR